MLCALCVLRWPSNFMKPPLEVAEVVEIVFNQKERPRPLDFIIEASLKDFGLAPVEGLQVAVAASLFVVVLPLASATLLEAVVSLADGFGIV